MGERVWKVGEMLSKRLIQYTICTVVVFHRPKLPVVAVKIIKKRAVSELRGLSAVAAVSMREFYVVVVVVFVGTPNALSDRAGRFRA